MCADQSIPPCGLDTCWPTPLCYKICDLNFSTLYRSKIFIRFPKTLFKTEDSLEAKKPDIGKEKCRDLGVNSGRAVCSEKVGGAHMWEASEGSHPCLCSSDSYWLKLRLPKCSRVGSCTDRENVRGGWVAGNSVCIKASASVYILPFPGKQGHFVKTTY